MKTYALPLPTPSCGVLITRVRQTNNIGCKKGLLRVRAEGPSAPSPSPPSPTPPKKGDDRTRSPSPESYLKNMSMTERIFCELKKSAKDAAGGAGGDNSFEGLLRADNTWRTMRDAAPSTDPAPMFVFNYNTQSTTLVPDHDVILCGGTLGIFLAAALQKRGLSVGLVERFELKGRDQDWNTSRVELASLIEYGVMTWEEMEACVGIEWNPCYCGFHGGERIAVSDVLNVGVSPRRLIETAKANFLKAGGKLYENTPVDGVDVYKDSVSVVHRKRDEGDEPLGPDERQALTAKILLDCMGHQSPIVRQMRWGKKPDGVCLVVGSMARGFEANDSSDVIATTEDSRLDKSLQYFWEAFPASDGPKDRTTYLFTYLDASPDRPSLLDVFEDYFKLMPSYQNVKLEDLEFIRLMYGVFPTYRDSPLRPSFDRILQVGDASGIQSPLSFGGFGAMLRHLPRLVTSVEEAIASNSLDKDSLALVNAYTPNLASSWLLQRSMSIQVGADKPKDFINKVMRGNFGVMRELGPNVMMPFLQDIVQPSGLATILFKQVLNEPKFVPTILSQLEPRDLMDWLRHFTGAGTYQALHNVAGPRLKELAKDLPANSKQRFRLNRIAEAWEYGSGMDHSRLHDVKVPRPSPTVGVRPGSPAAAAGSAAKAAPQPQPSKGGKK